MESKILKSVFILAISFFLNRILLRFIKIPAKKVGSKTKTIIDFLKNAVAVIIYILAILAILSTWGIDVTPYLLSSSIVGFAFAFGAQGLIRDIISGIYLLLEPEFKIGRKIKVGNFTGRLKKVSLKNIYIEGEEGDLYIIPNGEVKTIVVNKR